MLYSLSDDYVLISYSLPIFIKKIYMAKFVITKRKNGEFQFSLKADNGETILSSEGYYAKAACLNGIESVKKNGIDDSNYSRNTSTNEKYYFNLKANNGQIIGTSEMYVSPTARDQGIDAVKRSVLNITIEDLTD
jgi:uncharacterized protein YegP (UPF0339 family)